MVAAREADADEFYTHLAPRATTPEQLRVLRQASAGLVWSKQIYPYDVSRWLDGDPGQPPPPDSRRGIRNEGWRHLDSFDVLAMPDPWEYPWFAAWDLGFHAIAWAHLDPAFAKYQMLVLLREWFQHPNGALPAYEWNFDDVNPPVHVLAALRVYRIDGSRDREFLERVFQKLLVNFTWWLNREDADGNNVFGGGFLGLDNISPLDRSNLPDGVRLEQADGTAWMAYYAMSMLVIAVELAEQNPVYDDMVVKFLEQFLQIRRALEEQGLYDETDAFFYDRLVHPSGESTPVRVRTIAGLIPLLPAVGLPRPQAAYVDRLGKGFANIRESWARHGGTLAGLVRELDGRENILVSVLHPDDVRLALKEFLDEDAFLSPHGLRSVSKRYEGRPYSIPGMPGATIDYEPAESTTAMFGGNSNWRGPVWMPLNYLAVRQFVRWQMFLGDDFTLEYPTGGGVHRTFGEIAQDLADRLVSIWLPGRARPPAGLRCGGPDAGGPGVEGQPALLRVLPRRRRCRSRRDAPDRLDRTRRRPAPRPAGRVHAREAGSVDGDVDRVRRGAAGEGVGEAHDVRLDRAELGPQESHEVVVRRVVGPQREDPAGVQVAVQGAQPLGRVERRVAGVQHVPRGVVDVEQHGVHAVRAVGPEPAGHPRRERRSRPPPAGSAGRW